MNIYYYICKKKQNSMRQLVNIPSLINRQNWWNEQPMFNSLGDTHI